MRRTTFDPIHLVLLSALLTPVAAGCGTSDTVPTRGLDAITVDGLATHIGVLASDEFEGRAPATPGEEKTIAYLTQEFRRLGLQPGNGDSFVQRFPVVSITGTPTGDLRVAGPSGEKRFAFKKEFVAWTRRVVPASSVANSDMIFVGYGVVAPEYDWNDYAGIDARGKTVVMLVNDPGFATKDTALFNGNAMTYYGRWTYKFEEAARQGAAAAFIVHETAPAAYPWAVVENGFTGPQFGLVADDDNRSRAAIEGWMTVETARSVFQLAGADYDSLKVQASRRGFGPIPLGLTASVGLTNAIARSNTSNVLAVLPGRTRPDEYVVYMAHWDHFGRDSTLEGDQIYNGARDNATGTAALLELATAFEAVDARPARSLLFLAVGGEEQGLLGSAYYAAHPVYPPSKTVAALNIDAMNIWGPTRDITVVGYGNSELDDVAEEAARAEGRILRPDPEVEKGYFYRSDHFSFAKIGVPAFYADPGIDNIEHGEAWGLEQREKYTAERYHKVTDEVTSDWDLQGAVDDLRFLFRMGYRLANESTFPTWREGTEFRALRDSTMAATP